MYGYTASARYISVSRICSEKKLQIIQEKNVLLIHGKGPGEGGGVKEFELSKALRDNKKTQKGEKRGRVLRKAQLLYEKHDYNVCKRYF